MEKWKSTNHRGIRYREHETRKVGRVQKDKYYCVRFTVRGKCTETGIGWLSEKVTLAVAIGKLEEFKKNAKKDDGSPTKMKELYAADAARMLQRITVKAFIEQHYIPFSKSTKSDGQHLKEVQHIEHWITPAIGDKALKELTDISVILVLKDRMTDAGKSTRMIEYVVSTLGQIFKHGQTKEIISPIAKMPSLKLSINNARQRFLSRDEAASLLSLVRERDTQLADMAEFSLLTGCRRGELFGIKWGDINLETRSVLLLDTKNKSSRNLYLTERAVEIIQGQPPGSAQDHLFQTQSGKEFKDLPRSWHAALTESGLNTGVTDSRMKVVWHTLRHTSASWLAIGGVDLFKIAKILGHRDLKMTQRYSHLSEESVRDAIESTMKGL